MELSKLHDAWINAGQKVADLQDKRQMMAVELVADPSKYTADEVSTVNNDLNKSKSVRDLD